jgi:hypothetical protein
LFIGFFGFFNREKELPAQPDIKLKEKDAIIKIMKIAKEKCVTFILFVYFNFILFIWVLGFIHYNNVWIE